MSQHKVTVEWAATSDPFSYEQYTRDHVWIFENGLQVAASAAPQFLGSPDYVDPEEAFVASIASCHMLTFLAICARAGVIVQSYRDDAVCFLERDAQNILRVTRVVLRPMIEFAPDQVLDNRTVRDLHDKAHKGCFIANSVTADITIESTVSEQGN